MQKVFERGLRSGIPYRKFGKTNWDVSAIGLGCAPLGDVYGNLDHPARVNIVKYAIDNGINLLDTSPYYGESKSEINLGLVLNELSQHPSQLYTRDQYHLCTKVGRYSAGKHDYSGKRVEQSIQHSLQRLYTDYLDVVSIHDFEFVGFYPDDKDGSLEQIWKETLPALEEQKQKGIISHYGLSGRPLNVMDYVGRKYGYDKISTLLTYNNYNLTDEKLMNYTHRLNKYNIGIMQGGVTLLGLLTPQGPQTWNNAPEIIKDKCKKAVEIVYKKTDGDKLQKMHSILRLSFLHGMDNKNISTILVGPTSTEQLENNIQWIKDSNGGNLNENDKELIQYLQNEIFADIMNLGWIEDGTQFNIAESMFESHQWQEILMQSLQNPPTSPPDPPIR